MISALTMTGAPPEHWQIEGTAIFLAAVAALAAAALFAVAFFGARAIARRLDRKDGRRG